MKREAMIAEVCHEANRMYCESIGDFSLKRWLDAPEWQRESAINGVYIVIKNPGLSPLVCHNAWLKYKLRDGWKYGPVENPDLKNHPCCVPYAELPEAQKLKDVLFIVIVRLMVENNQTLMNFQKELGSHELAAIAVKACELVEKRDD